MKRNENCKDKKDVVKRGKANNRKQSGRFNKNSKGTNDNARKGKFAKDVEEEIEQDSKMRNANDPSWYSNSPELLKAAGSLPFTSMLGGKVYSAAVPGICVVTYCPAFGGEDGIPINQAFNSMYSKIVHANSRNYQYNAPDLAMLCMAGGQVFSILNSMARVYGIMKYYQQRNLYVPDPLVYAMGFNPDNLRASLPQMWFQLNNLIEQTRQIWVPNVFPIFDRWSWMNSTVFTDAEGVTSQIYLYVQDTYFIYNEVESETGGMLTPVTIEGNGLHGKLFTPPTTQYNWDVWVKVAQNMITALVNSEDRGIIFGDILNAYGTDNIRAMQQFPSDYIVGPEYNAEVLTQFENIVTTDKTINGIGQVNNKIVQAWARNAAPEFESDLTHNTTNWILNFHFPNQPTPEQIMVATRMMAGYYTDPNIVRVPSYDYTTHQWDLTSTFVGLQVYGSELPHKIIMWDEVPQFGNVEVPVPTEIPQVLQPNLEDRVHMENWMYMTAFDWHPFFYVTSSAYKVIETTGEVTVNAAQLEPAAAFGDYDNYIKISKDNIKQLHRVALFSLWGVPHM